ncbi:uncharacterized protein LOC127514870 [Ctenopharyngodon idella]|uniref:uncharacterized protein LOC127514870 n=1 Tax=Ctenopharyngodon idella TaxID=7959 RepID=UPI002231BD6C|nr:uncharacterized protein LOC127514870 [Ctenopharyngodon idella]
MYHQLPFEKKSLSCDHHFHLMVNRNSQSQRAAKMPYVLRYSFLLISICIRSMSCEVSVQVLKASGHDIIIECATDKIPQDGVYMYKQEAAAKERQEIFYCYKPDIVTHKTMSKSKVSVRGALPNLNVTLLHVTAEDNGLYWCEFNMEEKTTLGKFTWLWIDEKEKECPEECLKECPQNALSLVMILILCAVGLLSIACIIYMIQKCCSGKRNYKPSNVPSDSVYEEMKRSNLDTQPNVRTFINPDYQSSKQLR